VTTVAAVVVTYNDQGALDACLASLDAQTRQPDVIVVVDNASTPPARATSSHLDVQLIRSGTNTGPAGGFADGFEAALAGQCDYIWAMDDDCEPEPDALSTLLVDANHETVVFPKLISSGSQMYHPAWCGVIIPRRVADAVGVPRRDFVWWLEDTEYLQWRVPNAGFDSLNSGASVHTGHPRRAQAKPPWKHYYEARNALFYRLYLNRTNLVRRLLRLTVRVPAGIVLRGDRRLACLWMHLRGLADGLVGRLGMRVPLT
jgi:GT2 family glycosyltransferase